MARITVSQEPTMTILIIIHYCSQFVIGVNLVKNVKNIFVTKNIFEFTEEWLK